MSILHNLESQPNIDNYPPYPSIILLVLFFELKWLNFLEGMASHVSQEKQKDLSRKNIRFVLK